MNDCSSHFAILILFVKLVHRILVGHSNFARFLVPTLIYEIWLPLAHSALSLRPF